MSTIVTAMKTAKTPSRSDHDQRLHPVDEPAPTRLIAAIATTMPR